VTELPATVAISPETGPVFPPGRYGRRRAQRRTRPWLAGLLAALTVLAMVAVAWTLYQRYGAATATPTVVRYYDLDDNGVTIEFRVRKAADIEVTCRVRSRGYDGAEVGRADVRIGRGRNVTATYTLGTSARPVTAEVTRCDPVS